jgi:hypothetical protein
MNEPLELIGDVDGPYRLRVTAPDSHAQWGRYAITLRRVKAATEVHPNRIAAARAFAGGMAAFKPLVREALLQSIAGLEEALDHWHVAHDPSEEAGTLSEMGMMYIQLGDQSKATDCARQALTARDR